MDEVGRRIRDWRCLLVRGGACRQACAVKWTGCGEGGYSLARGWPVGALLYRTGSTKRVRQCARGLPTGAIAVRQQDRRNRRRRESA